MAPSGKVPLYAYLFGDNSQVETLNKGNYAYLALDVHRLAPFLPHQALTLVSAQHRYDAMRKQASAQWCKYSQSFVDALSSTLKPRGFSASAQAAIHPS